MTSSSPIPQALLPSSPSSPPSMTCSPSPAPASSPSTTTPSSPSKCPSPSSPPNTPKPSYPQSSALNPIPLTNHTMIPSPSNPKITVGNRKGAYTCDGAGGGTPKSGAGGVRESGRSGGKHSFPLGWAFAGVGCLWFGWGLRQLVGHSRGQSGVNLKHDTTTGCGWGWICRTTPKVGLCKSLILQRLAYGLRTISLMF